MAPESYRVGEEVRSVKRDLGLRRGSGQSTPKPKAVIDFSDAYKNLTRVSKRSPDPVLRAAAKSLQEYLQ